MSDENRDRSIEGTSPAEFDQGILVEDLRKVLARSPHPEEEWLWCLECTRFFQAKHLQIDSSSSREGCPFCGAAGFNVDIYKWDALRHDEPGERWPKSESELSHGMELEIG